MKRILATLVLATVLVACGDDKEKVAYRPIAFGENGQCYYVHDPVEVIELQNAGLCDRSWVPTVMPITWRQMYYPYYASPAYYDVYVPRTTRTVFIEQQRSWGEKNRTAVAQASKGARYRGSNGKEVSADKIGATKYGSGNRFGPVGTKFGGGDRTTRVTSAPTPTPVATVGDRPSTSPSAPSNSPTTKASGSGSGGDTKVTPKPKPAPKPPAPKPSGGGSKPSGGGSKSYGGGGGSKSYGGGKR